MNDMETYPFAAKDTISTTSGWQYAPFFIVPLLCKIRCQLVHSKDIALGKSTLGRKQLETISIAGQMRGRDHDSAIAQAGTNKRISEMDFVRKIRNELLAVEYFSFVDAQRTFFLDKNVPTKMKHGRCRGNARVDHTNIGIGTGRSTSKGVTQNGTMRTWIASQSNGDWFISLLLLLRLLLLL